MHIKNVMRNFLKFVCLGLFVILVGCLPKLPPLPEQEPGPPSLTIKTMLPDNYYWGGVSTRLFEINTKALFFADASDVRDDEIIYAWFINEEPVEGETGDQLFYTFNLPGIYTLKATATTGSETTSAVIDIAVFKKNIISGRSIENGTYSCKFDSDDDGADETYTYTFSGTNTVKLQIEGFNEGPSDSYSLSGNWKTTYIESNGGNNITIDFLLKKDNINGDLIHSLSSNDEWMVFDYNGKTYLYVYPLFENENYEQSAFAINSYYSTGCWYNTNNLSNDCFSEVRMTKDNISTKGLFYCGINKDTIPVFKTFNEEFFNWNLEELANGAYNQVLFNGRNYLFYSGAMNVMRPGFLLEKQ